MPGTWAQVTMTIASGATTSASINLNLHGGRQPNTFIIVAPSTLPETINIDLTVNSQAGLLQSGGSDIIIPAGRATQVLNVSGDSFTLRATASVAAERTFELAIGTQ